MSKLFVATPMFGAMCSGIYTSSLVELALLFKDQNIPLQFDIIYNNASITSARNQLAWNFSKSDATHLLFVDADIGFNPKDVLTLLNLQTDDSPYDIIGGSYLRKRIIWKNVINAAKQNATVDQIQEVISERIFSPLGGWQEKILIDNPNEPMEIAKLGTGFMMIRRATFDLVWNKFPEFLYKDIDLGEIVCRYFQSVVDFEGHLTGEDYFFCNCVRAAGGHVWLHPRITVSHFGSFIFGGPYREIFNQ